MRSYLPFMLFFPAAIACGAQTAQPPVQTLFDSPGNPIRVTVSGRQYRVERYSTQGNQRQITALNNRGERVILVDANGNDRLRPAEGDIAEEVRYGSALRCEGNRAMQRRPRTDPAGYILGLVTGEPQYEDTVFDAANPDKLTRDVIQRCSDIFAGYDTDLGMLRRELEREIARR